MNKHSSKIGFSSTKGSKGSLGWWGTPDVYRRSCRRRASGLATPLFPRAAAWRGVRIGTQLPSTHMFLSCSRLQLHLGGPKPQPGNAPFTCHQRASLSFWVKLSIVGMGHSKAEHTDLRDKSNIWHHSWSRVHHKGITTPGVAGREGWGWPALRDGKQSQRCKNGGGSPQRGAKMTALSQWNKTTWI